MTATTSLIRFSCVVALQATGMTSKSGKLRHLLEEGLVRVGNHLLMTATMNKIRFSYAVALLVTGITSKNGKLKHLPGRFL